MWPFKAMGRVVSVLDARLTTIAAVANQWSVRKFWWSTEKFEYYSPFYFF